MVSAEEFACCQADPVTPRDHPVRCAIRGVRRKVPETANERVEPPRNRHLSDGRRRPAGRPREARDG